MLPLLALAATAALQSPAPVERPWTFLVYGAADLKAGATGSLYNVCADPRLNHNPPVTHGLLAGAAAELLSTFFAAKRA